MVIKKIIAYIVSITMIFSYIVVINLTVYANETMEEKMVGTELVEVATNYAKKYYKEMVQIIQDMHDEFGITTFSLDNIFLGDPYYIYDVDKDTQNAEIHFPVYENDNIILVLNVVCMEDGWSISMNTQSTDILNELNYDKEDCVFYSIDNIIYAENSEMTVVLNGEKEENIEEKEKIFLELSLEEKEKKSEENLNNIRPIKIKKEGNQVANIGASPGAVNTDNGRYLDAHNFYTGQGNYNLCWAACVATTYRYRTQTKTLTAKNVADTLNEKYTSWGYDGASDATILKAFETYGLNYKLNLSVPAWSVIKKNINYNQPVTLVGRRWEDENKVLHATLITGYIQYNSESVYIKIWDPKDETVQLVKYPIKAGERGAFVSGGMSYGFDKTFSYYFK